MIGEWSVETTGGGLLRTTHLSIISIQGGELGQTVGRIEYFVVSGGLEPRFSCEGTLNLVSSTSDAIIINDRTESRSLFCPGNKRISVQIADGQLWVTWTRVSGRSERVVMQGWAERVQR